MKLKNWKFVSTIGTIALAGIVAIPTLTLTSCSGGSSTPTKINIYGTTDIHGSLQDSAQLNAVDNIGNDVTQGSWTISETIPGFSFSNTQPGKLIWNVNAAGIYHLSIQVTAEGLTATKSNIAIAVSDAPAPATTFTIYGESTINGIAGLSGNGSYNAVDNNGNDVTNNSTWSLISAPANVSINNGTLNWTNSLSANIYTFAIHCVSGALIGQDKSATLTITTPKPAATSINVYGAPTINGVAGTAGNMQYAATNNNGETLTSPTWSITTLAGVSINNSGLLSWTASAAAGTITISCAASGLTTGTLSVTLNITTPKPAATSINVYGAPTINGVAGTAGSMQYAATNNNGETLTSPTWSITTLAGVSINNSGVLSWADNATAGTFTISCAASGLTTGTLSVTLTITTPKPVATSINVYGAPAINGVAGTAGNMQYAATNNNGESLTSPTWSITTLAGVSISNSGVLSWAANATAGTFTISCAASGLTTGTLSVTLNITTPKPAATSINVYGAPTINGVAGTAGSMQYAATNNNGETLTSPTWSITTLAGVSISNSGVLSWADNATAGTFTISCAASGLTTGTLQVTLNFITPLPEPNTYKIYGPSILVGTQTIPGSVQFIALDEYGMYIPGAWAVNYGGQSGAITISIDGWLRWDSTSMSGSLSIGFTPGYPGIHGDDFAVTLFLNPVSDNLSISGPTAIAIPYENTFAYSCVGGTIDTDSSLPNGFHFDTGTNTLTYSGVQPSTDGIIKLKSTSFSGEKHDGLIVHYYPISSIQDNNCLFLKPDGSTTSIQMTVNTDNCVDIPIPPAIQDPLIRNSVRVIFGNINLIFSDIWDDFLSGFTSLQKIYFPTQFNQVTRIRSNFLSNDSSLESIDFSNLSQVTEILDGFCNNLASLSYIDLSPFNNVDYVGSMFLSGAKSLKYVDFSNWTSLYQMDDYFLANCPSLLSINMSGWNNLNYMIGGFLFNDISIRSVDFSSCDALHWIDDLTINVGILCGLSSLCEIILPNNDLFDDPYPSLGWWASQNIAIDSFQGVPELETCFIRGNQYTQNFVNVLIDCGNNQLYFWTIDSNYYN